MGRRSKKTIASTTAAGPGRSEFNPIRTGQTKSLDVAGKLTQPDAKPNRERMASDFRVEDLAGC